MMKKVMFTANLALLVSLLVPVTSLAQTRDQSQTRERDDSMMQEDRSMRPADPTLTPRPSDRAPVTGEMREQAMEDRSQERETRANAFMERLIKRLQAAIERIEGLLTRVDSRITKLEERGLDMSTARTRQREAVDYLAQARAAVNDLLPVAIAVGDDASLFGQTIRNLQERARMAIDLIKKSHAAVVEVIRAIKASLPEVDPTTAPATDAAPTDPTTN
jgi:hypothetical protein